MLYGAPIRPPADFIQPQPSPVSDSVIFETHLCDVMNGIAPSLPSYRLDSLFVPLTLQTCSNEWTESSLYSRQS